jgi:hypothetical protein
MLYLDNQFMSSHCLSKDTMMVFFPFIFCTIRLFVSASFLRFSDMTYLIYLFESLVCISNVVAVTGYMSKVAVKWHAYTPTVFYER